MKQKTMMIAAWVAAGLTIGAVSAGAWYFRQRDGTPPAAHTYADTEDAATRLRPMFDAPAFTLTDQDGKSFSSEQLRGKVWVADFVFTTCPSMCPLMTRQFADFQNATPGSPVQMVSFSVDPEHDTPRVLKQYADQNRADLSRWHFLTGDKEGIWKVSVGMKLAVGPGDAEHQVMHSSHFLLVDRGGKVRGVYDYKDAGYMKKLIADAQSLTEAKD